MNSNPYAGRSRRDLDRASRMLKMRRDDIQHWLRSLAKDCGYENAGLVDDIAPYVEDIVNLLDAELKLIAEEQGRKQ